MNFDNFPTLNKKENKPDTPELDSNFDEFLEKWDLKEIIQEFEMQEGFLERKNDIIKGLMEYVNSKVSPIKNDFSTNIDTEKWNKEIRETLIKKIDEINNKKLAA